MTGARNPAGNSGEWYLDQSTHLLIPEEDAVLEDKSAGFLAKKLYSSKIKSSFDNNIKDPLTDLSKKLPEQDFANYDFVVNATLTENKKIKLNLTDPALIELFSKPTLPDFIHPKHLFRLMEIYIDPTMDAEENKLKDQISKLFGPAFFKRILSLDSKAQNETSYSENFINLLFFTNQTNTPGSSEKHRQALKTLGAQLYLFLIEANKQAQQFINNEAKVKRNSVERDEKAPKEDYSKFTQAQNIIKLVKQFAKKSIEERYLSTFNNFFDQVKAARAESQPEQKEALLSKVRGDATNFYKSDAFKFISSSMMRAKELPALVSNQLLMDFVTYEFAGFSRAFEMLPDQAQKNILQRILQVDSNNLNLQSMVKSKENLLQVKTVLQDATENRLDVKSVNKFLSQIENFHNANLEKFEKLSSTQAKNMVKEAFLEINGGSIDYLIKQKELTNGISSLITSFNANTNLASDVTHSANQTFLKNINNFLDKLGFAFSTNNDAALKAFMFSHKDISSVSESVEAQREFLDKLIILYNDFKTKFPNENADKFKNVIQSAKESYLKNINNHLNDLASNLNKQLGSDYENNLVKNSSYIAQINAIGKWMIIKNLAEQAYSTNVNPSSWKELMKSFSNIDLYYHEKEDHRNKFETATSPKNIERQEKTFKTAPQQMADPTPMQDAKVETPPRNSTSSNSDSRASVSVNETKVESFSNTSFSQSFTPTAFPAIRNYNLNISQEVQFHPNQVGSYTASSIPFNLTPIARTIHPPLPPTPIRNSNSLLPATPVFATTPLNSKDNFSLGRERANPVLQSPAGYVADQVLKNISPAQNANSIPTSGAVSKFASPPPVPPKRRIISDEVTSNDLSFLQTNTQAYQPPLIITPLNQEAKQRMNQVNENLSANREEVRVGGPKI